MTTGAMICLYDLPKLESKSYKAMGYKASIAELSRFGQATVKTLKDMLLNVIVIEKNCCTSVTKSPGL